MGVDDAHFGDAPSWDLIDHALGALRDESLLVIALGRPELTELFPRLFAAHEPQLHRVGRLSSRAARKLADALSQTARPEDRPSEPRLEEMVARAEGNPFFLEEMVRSALERPDAELPETVLATVQGRLRGLDAEERRVLRAASVYGRNFWGGALSPLLGRHDPPDAALERLEAAELLDDRGGRELPGEWAWAFRQELVREAAYAALTDDDRRLGHELAAGWLIERGLGEARELATHYEGAALPEEAAQQWATVARAALDAGDYVGALTHAERGRALGPTGDGRALLDLAAAEAKRWQGDYAGALPLARSALAALVGGDVAGEALFRAAGNVLVSAGQAGAVRSDDGGTVVSAEEAMDDALGIVIAAVPSDVSASRQKLVAFCRAAHQRLAQRRLADVDALLGLIRQLAAQIGAEEPFVAAWLETTVAARAMLVGDLSAYVDGTERAIAAYDRAEDTRHACNQRVRLAYGYVELAQFERALSVATRAAEEGGTARRAPGARVRTSKRRTRRAPPRGLRAGGCRSERSREPRRDASAPDGAGRRSLLSRGARAGAGRDRRGACGRPRRCGPR